jgi:predicted transcriptional regulator YdeE
MDAEICRSEPFRVMGVQIRVNPMITDFEDLWHQFLAREAEVAAFSSKKVSYEAYFTTDQRDLVDCLAGMAVQGVEAAPEGLVLREVGGSEEAVFTSQMATIKDDWGAIFQEWMPASGYEPDSTFPEYERYVLDPGGGPPAVTIHIPIRQRRQ